MAVAVAVMMVMTMAPEAAVDVPVTVVMVVVMMAVPVTVVLVLVMTTAVVMTEHVAMTAMATALVSDATAVRTCIGSGRDQRCKADNDRRNESEECRTFEHRERDLLARCEPSEPLVGEPGRQVQAIDFRCVFVHLTFIDRATVWQAVDSTGLQLFAHRREIGRNSHSGQPRTSTGGQFG
jgi:hypothetical protein